jgi:hypothetical protein
MFMHFACDKAFFRIVHRGASSADAQTPLPVLCDNQRTLYLVGSVLCPRGCGTMIHWVLDADLSDHKEQFLVYLHQQLWWTDCPEHTSIRAQGTAPFPARDWTYLPTPSSVVGSGPRYRNLYE